MKKYINPPAKELSDILRRPTQTVTDLEPLVKQVFEEIQEKGDEALYKYTSLFDGVTPDSLELSAEQISSAAEKVPESLKTAIKRAYDNISAFHRAQRTERVEVETAPGVSCWQEKRPIEKVGLYIPGGSAPLFSTVLMLAIPAQLAGCREIVLCSPPDKEGKIHPAILYTANLCGVTRIFTLGGIQAIGAMTFGTTTVPPVYKIFGPGNQYVTVAKQLATRFGIAIDMPAGPSELMVVADDSARPEYVAADLLSQAEHGPDSQVILVSTSSKLIGSTREALDAQITSLPRRDIAEQAISNSVAIHVGSQEECLKIANLYGPEHLIVCLEDDTDFVKEISNAGSVFLGNYTPESAGDYASGTNHTLPTNGYARQYSGVNLDSFLKSVTFQKISKSGIRDLGPAIETMAEAEGLKAHSLAVSVRLKDLQS
ncbi:histidinol dehydrogenase [Robertkochia aurantiaca]|uniref:histidinol dehydrogenase n=1 Tax=Robertkochia aurantiaca TaxID=2873700 RepID=UPI001CCF6B70|nr:histidinol dehydrogenase [Robertkochia sp. 3YJGBD-33]